MEFNIDNNDHLQWEPTIVPTLDKPTYRVVELRKQQSRRRELYLLRTNDGEMAPSRSGSGSESEPLSLSLTALGLPFDSRSVDYTLVGSALGVLCFYLRDGNHFILWNPSTGLLCTLSCPDISCSAFTFFQSLSADDELIIIALTKTVTNGSTSHLRQYSTETSKWELLTVVKNDSREGSITGPGFLAGNNIYWGGYYENTRLDCVVMYDITLSRLSVIPTNAPLTHAPLASSPYDFLSLLTHATFIDSEVYFVLQRRTNHSSELFRLVEGIRWVFVCKTEPASYIIDLIAKDRLLVHTGAVLNMVDGNMKFLSRCPFAPSYVCPFVVVHLPTEEDVSSLKVYAEKNQKRSFVSKLKSVLGIRSGQSSPHLERKNSGSSSQSVSSSRPLRRGVMGSSSRWRT